MERDVAGTTVRGVDVDAETRCVHYDTDRDVVAIRAACCDTYYPCHACHDTLTDHDWRVIPRDAFDDPAVLCGACGATLTVREYADCDDACPVCGRAFNPGCKRHWGRYFVPRE
ncbi:CHY zinc finger protein [Halarchaeum sp. P4]|uniref:CHY zinc finger protein n=1 Tax=Halarchaeum sp. P4 TaxID=3421639 RepID=UPI003EBF8F77